MEKPLPLQEQDTKSYITEETCPKHVTIRFKTTTYPRHVTASAFKIPSTLSRFGLSEIVNHLLQTDKPVPFEFLIRYKDKKIFLRTSLKRFYVLVQKWPEEVDELEYVEAQPAPKSVDIIPHDDWVSDIVHLRNTSDGLSNTEYLATGCYDGKVRIIDAVSGKVLSLHSHTRPITSVDIRRCAGIPNDLLVLSSSHRENVHLSYYNHKTNIISSLSILKGHNARVNKVMFNDSGNVMFTASADKSIKIWNVTASRRRTNDNNNINTQQNSRKRTRYTELESEKTLTGHHLSVTSLCWKNNATILSGSADHSIKIWDINQTEVITTIRGSKVISSLTYNPKLNVILSSHPDWVIRMWDPRQKDAKASVFRSHKGWVRSVCWGTNTSFISGADDNKLKVWDIRSAIPLHSVSHHYLSVEEKVENEETNRDYKARPRSEFNSLVAKLHKKKIAKAKHKVLCVRYSQGDDHVLFSGCTDCTVKKHTLKKMKLDE